MAHRCARGYAILEHRLVAAESLGRPLKVGEVVHHIDGNNLNNDISNLLLLSSQAHHSAYTMLQTQINRMEEELAQVRSRLILVEAENELLKFRVSMQGIGNLELAEADDASGKCRDYTLPTLFIGQGKEKVHPSRKLGDKGA